MSDTKVHKVGNDVVVLNDGSNSVATIIAANGLTTTTNSVPDSKSNVKEPKDPDDIKTSREWSIWGDNDDWPNVLQETLQKLGVARSALDINSDFHFGQGIQWVKQESNADGTVKHVISNPSDWREWAYTSGFYSALSDDINSRDTFGISFIRVRLTNNGKIYSMDTLDTPSCRLGMRNSKGFIEKIYYDYNIHEKSSGEEAVKLEVYDPSNHDAFIKKNKVFVLVNKIRTWGRFYYPEPNYYATIRNGWADIALEVPKLIKNIYKNQATLKYHIKIPYNNLLAAYPCFEEKSESEKLSLIAEYKRGIDEVISGAEAAGKSVFTLFQDGAEKVEITDIKSAIDNTKDLPNNIAANSEILFAIGVAPSIIGLNMPGGKDLNGSGGSQLRESIKAKQATLTRERLKSLELCYFVKKMNGYPSDIHPVFVDIDISQTLDENPTGKKNVIQG